MSKTNLVTIHPSSPQSAHGLGWVRVGIGIATVGFFLVAVAQYFIRDQLTLYVAIDGAAALVCGVIFALSARNSRAAGLFVIGTIWLELTFTIYSNAEPEVSSTLVFPVLILTIALLVGENWAMGAALVTGATIPFAVFAGRSAQGIAGDRTGVIVSIVVVEIVLGCAGLFGRVLLRAFRELLANSERLRARYTRLFQDMPDGLIETDPAGRIVETNAAATRLFGADGGKVDGELFSAVLARHNFGPALDPAAIRPGLPALLQAGSRHLEVTAGRPLDVTGSALLVVRDVTTRQQLIDKQAQVQRLETVGQLAGGIAHEFNNLLTAIGGNAGLLKTHDDPDVQQFAGQILAAQQRAATLTRQMLAFARHDLHQPEIISLSRELLEWGGLLRHLLGEHCRLAIKGEGTAWVEADPVQVEQILVHLLNNARDATPAGGQIEVRYARLPRPEAQQLGSTLEAGCQILLEVADRGSGMTPEVKRRLFEPFFTTKGPGRGTGLGLAAVHGLVQQNRGAIEIESASGEGTTVRLFFPEVDAGSRPASNSPVGSATPTRGHILLVDNDSTACRTAVFALEQGGYQVTIIDNGFEAVKFIRQNADISLAIVSVALPVLAGLDLAERLRKVRPGLPMLYVCGRFDLPAGWPANAQTHPLLIKPFRADELLTRVTGLLPPTDSPAAVAK